MKESEKKRLLDLVKEKELQNLNVELNTSALEEIIDDLIKVPSRDRIYFLEYVRQFIENVFQKSIHLSGLDALKSTYFDQPVRGGRGKDAITDRENLSFNDKLKKFVLSIPNFNNLKNFFIIDLFVDHTFNFEVVVLHDDTYFISAIKRSMEAELGALPFLAIDQSVDFFKEHDQSNFICLVLVSPRINDNKRILEIRSQLVSLLESFETFNYITIKDAEVKQFNDFYTKNSDRSYFLEEFDYVTDHFLTHSDLEFEEEKIIKRLFKDLEFPILDYKILNGGQSGAKVVEVNPKRKFADNKGKKYVVKIAKDKEKVKQEGRRFGHYIADYSSLANKYRIESDSTVNFSGIKYEYASPGKMTKAYSVSDILFKTNHPLYDRIDVIVSNIFEETCFPEWKTILRSEERVVKELYSEYLKLDKTWATIAEIEQTSTDEIVNSKFAKQFLQLIAKRILVKLKICHGDLHTGNFLVDDNQNTYLIDFAFTDLRHALIDHTSLECSLKFNHIPKYIRIEELEAIEREFLSADSFYPTFQIKSTNRNDLRKFYSLISKIRNNSIDCIQDKTSRDEYLISLLMITFRQINYPDLNQLFAWSSAKILMEHLSLKLNI